MAMKVRNILSFILGAIMFAGFLAQMWDLFNHFLSGMKTLAITYKEEDTIEFPSFAICDSRAFKAKTLYAANATQYNATTYNLEALVSFSNLYESEDWKISYTVELVPTIYNGYCMLYEFNGNYPPKANLGKH